MIHLLILLDLVELIKCYVRALRTLLEFIRALLDDGVIIERVLIIIEVLIGDLLRVIKGEEVIGTFENIWGLESHEKVLVGIILVHIREVGLLV